MRKLLAVTAAIATAFAAHAEPDPTNWEAVTEEARGQTVYWNAWGGSDTINSFIACYGGNLNTPELLAKGVEASLAGGADEITIYRGDAIDELKMWPAIRQAVERTVSEKK